MADRCDFLVENSLYLLRVVIFGLARDGFVVDLIVYKRVGQCPIDVGALFLSR